MESADFPSPHSRSFFFPLLHSLQTFFTTDLLLLPPSEGETGALHLGRLPSLNQISHSIFPSLLLILIILLPSCIAPSIFLPLKIHPTLLLSSRLNLPRVVILISYPSIFSTLGILGRNPLVFLTMYLTTILTLLPLLRPG